MHEPAAAKNTVFKEEIEVEAASEGSEE